MLTAARDAAVAPVAFLVLAFGAVVAHAQDEDQYQVEQDSPVWLRGVLDVRVARGGAPPSWTDSGPGKTRYGGERTASGFERETRYEVAQLALELGAALPGGIRGQAQVNLQPDVEDQPMLIEALLRKEWGEAQQGLGLQAGLMNIPFSLEHVGAAWAPDYALSASALNSWLWEEISLAGLEVEWWREPQDGLRLGFIVGAGYGPDQLGRLLALRGWTTGDTLSGINTDLPLPSGVRTEIFDERDDRPAAYAWFSVADASDRIALRVGHFDNFGDENTAGVWNTHFSIAGVTLHPHPSIDVLAQYLRGEARVRDTTNDTSLRAYYGLASWHSARHRLSARYDWFRLEDVDGGNNTSEQGDAITFAYFYQLGLRHRFGFEHTWLDSDRPVVSASTLSHDGWQLSYRFRY
jgi:hypothetical protein